MLNYKISNFSQEIGFITLKLLPARTSFIGFDLPLQFPSIDCSDLLMMERYSPLELRQDMGDDDDNDEEIGDLYPSLMELSMGHSPSPDGSREDLMTMSLTCDDDGDFGVVLRHFTVVANVPVSFVDTL